VADEKKDLTVGAAGIVGLGGYLVVLALIVIISIWNVVPPCDVRRLIATELTPSQVLTAGGERLRIRGEGFELGVTVRIGETKPLAAAVISPLEIVVTTPKHAVGRVAVVVEREGLPAVTVPGGLEFVEKRPTAPVVTSVTPAQVLITGGEQVRVRGERFTAGARVKIGAAEPAAAQFVSPSELVLAAPAQASGVVDVTVQQDSGTSTLPAGLQFVQTRTAPAPLVVSTIDPETSSTGGGEAVSIIGSGFTPQTTVRFGGSPARSVHVDGSRFITAVTPMHPAGAVSVIVGNEENVSSLPGRFSFQCPAPSDGMMVLLVLFAGALGGLVHALRSFFWYVGEQKLVWNWVPMYLLIPFASSALGFVFYLVIRAGLYEPSGGTAYLLVGLAALVGMFSAQASEKLKKVAEGIFTEAPRGPDSATLKASTTATATVLMVTPATGPLAGGNTVTIAGSGFGLPCSVRFGDTPAKSVTIKDANTLTVVVPAGKTAGVVDVGVTASGAPEVVRKDAYTYTAAAGTPGATGTTAPTGTITGVSPNQGPAAGGTPVTLTGSGFVAGVSVKFGQALATDVTVTNPTTITAKTPPQKAPGAVDVRVDNGTATVGISPSGFQYT